MNKRGEIILIVIIVLIVISFSQNDLTGMVVSECTQAGYECSTKDEDFYDDPYGSCSAKSGDWEWAKSYSLDLSCDRSGMSFCCKSTTTTIQSTQPTPINGKCGSWPNYPNGGTFQYEWEIFEMESLCEEGRDPFDAYLVDNKWVWDCYGINGGNNVRCEANYGEEPTPITEPTTEVSVPEEEIPEKTCTDFEGDGCTGYIDEDTGILVEDNNWCWNNGWRVYCSICDYCVKCIGDYVWDSTTFSCKLPCRDVCERYGKRCFPGATTFYQECDYHGTDCLKWNTVKCPTGQICQDGDCVEKEPTPITEPPTEILVPEETVGLCGDDVELAKQGLKCCAGDPTGKIPDHVVSLSTYAYSLERNCVNEDCELITGTFRNPGTPRYLREPYTYYKQENGDCEFYDYVCVGETGWLSTDILKGVVKTETTNSGCRSLGNVPTGLSEIYSVIENQESNELVDDILRKKMFLDNKGKESCHKWLDKPGERYFTPPVWINEDQGKECGDGKVCDGGGECLDFGMNIIYPEDNSLVAAYDGEIDLEVSTTSNANCSYGLFGQILSLIPMEITGGTQHKQKISWLEDGDYILVVECVSKGAVDVYSGEYEEIDLGSSFVKNLNDDNNNGILEVGQGLIAETSLTSNEDDYMTDVVLEVAKNSIKYSLNLVGEIQSGITYNFLGNQILIEGIISDTSMNVEGKTVRDGDAFCIGKSGIELIECQTDPDWVWDLSGLNTNNPKIAIENDFLVNKDSDKYSTGVGECIYLPNDCVRICLDVLTVNDNEYNGYNIEYDSGVDLSDADGGSNEKTIWIRTNDVKGMQLEGGDYTNHIWIKGDGSVYYKNRDTNRVTYLTLIDQEDILATINDKDLELIAGFQNNGIGVAIKAPLGEDPIAELVYASFSIKDGEIYALGKIKSNEEDDELTWTWISHAKEFKYLEIGNKDEDHRTVYGIIIRDPKGYSSIGSGDRVILDIPNEQVKAGVSLSSKKCVEESKNSVKKQSSFSLINVKIYGYMGLITEEEVYDEGGIIRLI